MYPAVLLVHSWLRWLVILFAVIAVLRAVIGALGRRGWGRSDDLAGTLFLRTFDLQILLGLVLYFFLSPITRSALSDFGTAMKIGASRFWAVEHVFGMVVAMVLVHRGHVRVRAITDPVARHRVAAIFYALGLIAILASIPWPGTPNGRPLIRW